MKQLLQNKELRQLEIIEYFHENPCKISHDDLCDLFNLSSMTLQKYLQEISTNLPYIQLSEDNNYYQLDIPAQYGMSSIYNYYIQHNNSYKILFNLFFNNDTNPELMTQSLNCSETTLYRTIKNINKALSDIHFDFSISPTTLAMSGSEFHIRAFYNNLFFESHSLFDWPFATLNRSEIHELCVNTMLATHLNDNFSSVKRLMLLFAVNAHRIKDEHWLPIPETEYTIISNRIPQELQDSIGDFWTNWSGQPFNSQVLYELFYPIFKKDIMYNYAEFANHAITDPFINKSFFHIQKLIEFITNKYNFKSVNHFYLAINIHNNACLQLGAPGSYNIFRHSTQKTINSIKQWSPDFYNTTYYAMKDYLNEVFNNANPVLIEHLTFIFITYIDAYIDNFIDEQPKIKVLIVNQYSKSIANHIKNDLEMNFTSQLDIDILPTFPSKKIDDSNYDIILANCSIPKQPKALVIQVPMMPQLEDYKKLLQYIEVIRKRQTEEITKNYKTFQII